MLENGILSEIDAIPLVLHRGASDQALGCRDVVRALAGRSPRLLATIGRGSSDHVATFLRYAFEIRLGIPGASLAPSVASIYGRQLALDGALCLAISQSGRSPDLLRAAAMAQSGGALLVAIVNDAQSPLANIADVIIPIGAGPERATAATKSFVGAAAAGLRLLSALTEDASLSRELEGLPEMIARSEPINLDPVLDADTAFVVGRGPALGIAQEAALKLKELAQFSAEAFSSAEVRHGPWQLGATNCALLGWRTDAISAEGQQEVIRAYAALGRTVLDLQSIGTRDDATDGMISPLLPLPAFYRALALAARTKGLDVERPALLNKVTETV